MTGTSSDFGSTAEFPPYTEIAVQYLSQRFGLFDFSPGARNEIDSFYRDRDPSLRPAVAEQARALSYLHAAEYALLPAIQALADGLPSSRIELLLPPQQRVTVEDGHARLGLLKGDCSLIIWTHAPKGDRINSLNVSDLTAFSGDASKIHHWAGAWWPEDMAPNTSEVEICVRELYEQLRENPWEPAADVAWIAGQLQGLLWCVKSAVAEFRTEAQFGRYLEAMAQTTFLVGEPNPWTLEGPTVSERAGLSTGPTYRAQFQQLLTDRPGVSSDLERARASAQAQYGQAAAMYGRGALDEAQLAAASARIAWQQVEATHTAGAMTDAEFDAARARLLLGTAPGRRAAGA
jgi:hypothetical protein